MKVKSLSRVRLFATPWTVAHHAPLSMGFSRQELLEWVAMPSCRGSSWARDQICISYVLLHWQAGSLPPAPSGKPICELVQAIEIRRAGCQTGGDSGKIWYCSLGAEFFLWKPILLLKPSTDWMRPTYIRESNLLYSVYSFKCWTHPKCTSQKQLE